MAKRIKGTTAAFGGTSLGNVMTVGRNHSCEGIDTGWDEEEMEPGKKRKIKTLKCQGHPPSEDLEGTTGTLVITYLDGKTDTLTSAFLEIVDDQGGIEGQAETSYTFRKGAAAA